MGKQASEQPLKHPTENNPNQHPHSDADPRDFQHSNRIALSRHTGQAAGATREVCREGGKGFVLFPALAPALSLSQASKNPPSKRTNRMVQRILVPRVVVNIDRYRL